MSTRGLIGFYKKKVTKSVYNHYDSYPSHMGNIIKDYISTHSREQMVRGFENIRMVKEHDEVTPEDVISIKNFWYGDVGKEQSNLGWGDWNNWYILLHDKMGDISAYAENGYMIDGIAFMKDSLFCEWAYIINLDDNLLEIYRGFQTKPRKNRYSLTNAEKTAIKLENQSRDPGYYTTNKKTGKKIRRKIEAYYNCDLIAQIPFECIPTFDMEKFGELVYAEEEKQHCGKLIPDFTPGAITKDRMLTLLELLNLIKVDRDTQKPVVDRLTEELEYYAECEGRKEQKQIANAYAGTYYYGKNFLPSGTIGSNIGVFPDLTQISVVT